MNRLLFLIYVVIFLAACTNVSFVKSQPENIDPLVNIPERYHGIYEFEDSTINSESYLVTDSSIGDMILGQEIIVKQKGNFFFLNIFDEDRYGLYVVKMNWVLNYERIEMLFPNITDQNVDLFNILNLEEVLQLKGSPLPLLRDADYLLETVTAHQMNLLLKESMLDDPVILKRIR